MVWTAPQTWTDGTVVRAIQFNTDVRDNETYLKGRVDLQLSVQQAVVTNYALLSTHQNLTSTPKAVNVVMTTTATSTQGTMIVYCGSSATPTTEVAHKTVSSGVALAYRTISFLVPPDYYFYLGSAGSVAVNSCIEWNIYS